MPTPLPLLDLNILFSDFAQLERLGVVYGYGVKSPTEFNSKSIKLSDVTPAMIAHAKGSIDCSGWKRWATARATKGGILLPDGSQMQREQFEQWAADGLVREIKSHTQGDGNFNASQLNYRDAALNVTGRRLFTNFIKPFAHGCGDVGHVFDTALYNDGNNGTKCGTLESHGGGGCVSRPWNTIVLLREVFSTFEMFTVQGGN